MNRGFDRYECIIFQSFDPLQMGQSFSMLDIDSIAMIFQRINPIAILFINTSGIYHLHLIKGCLCFSKSGASKDNT